MSDVAADRHKQDREPSLIPGDERLTALRGVGPRVADRLAGLGLLSVRDLLLHLPFRYEDRTRVVSLGSLQAGQSAAIEGQVMATEIVGRGARSSLICRLSDGTGSVQLRFINYRGGHIATLTRGRRLRCFGEVRDSHYGLEMVHPEFRDAEQGPGTGNEENLTPVYPAGLGIHQLTLRRLTDQALAWLDDDRGASLELLPATIRHTLGLPGFAESVRALHQPPAGTDLELLLAAHYPARRRLAFEELLAHQLSLRALRRELQRNLAPSLDAPGQLLASLLDGLPFRPTRAQRRVMEEVRRDLAGPAPMLRLIQGDVGSGKTLVAAAAVLQAVDAGFQAAVMAPTELLAEQHWRTFSAWLEPLDVAIAWVAGSLKGKARAQSLEAIASGQARVAIGTHALFQEQVRFDQLALVVIDEQHRFGVHQRLALREKGASLSRGVHQLIMTATPIPRTLAMTAYADLDTSVIDELPPGRTPVQTVVVGESRREEVVARVDRACGEGRQAYWVCTLVEESEALQCQAAEVTATVLAEALPKRRIALVHGRMKSREKETIMAAFKQGEVDLLVATTVIEVGVDVANASLMIIENAERLGLAQLHQLRGRVGRGSVESYCVLLYARPLSEIARARLRVLRDSNDGFEIARRDLELRGPGELLGTRQTGLMQLKVADLARDEALLDQVQESADTMQREAPDAARQLVSAWLGAASSYAEV
jgi:ATP-dependent DNA helicase RecG